MRTDYISVKQMLSTYASVYASKTAAKCYFYKTIRVQVAFKPMQTIIDGIVTDTRPTYKSSNS